MERRQSAADWSALTPDLREAIEAWRKNDRSYTIEPRGWFTDGRSGEPVALVMRERLSDRDADQMILKVLTSNAAHRAYNLHTAWDVSKSFRAHLAEPHRAVLPFGGDLHGILMRVAGGNPSAFGPLTFQWKDSEFIECCARIVHSVVQEWNEGPFQRGPSTVGEVLGDMLGKHRGDALKWAHSVEIAVDSNGPVFKDGSVFRVNPFTLLMGSGANVGISDLFIGKAHGDLSGRNILLKGGPGVDLDPESYVLIDYDRYSPDAPLARDPMHLLVALVLDHFDYFGPDSWAELANALVYPDEDRHPEEVERFRRASSVFRKASAPDQDKGWEEEWERQCLLFLAGAALLHLGRELHVRNPQAAKDWCFHLASRAAEAFLAKPSPPAEPTTSPMPTPTAPTLHDGNDPAGSIKDRTRERGILRDRLTSGERGVAVLQGARGVGKTKVLDVVLKGLEREDAGPRILRHKASSIAKIDAGTLIDYLEGDQAGCRAGQSSLVRLEQVLQGLGGSRVVLAVDSAENLLDPDSKTVVDPHLDRALEMLATKNDHGVTVLLVSQESPASPTSGMRWPTSEPTTVRLDSLPLDDFLAYMAELDYQERLDSRLLTQESRGALYRVMKGNPRLAELAYAVVVADSGLDLPQLADFLNSKQDVSGQLMNLLLYRLDETRRRVLQALAAFDTPVPAEALVKVLSTETEVEDALSTLVADHIVYREADNDDDQYFLPSSDSRLIIGAMPADEREDVCFAVADALTELTVPTPGAVGELRLHFAALKALLLAGEYLLAHKMITTIDSFLREWNCRHLLLEQRTEVTGKLADEHGELENLNALADIYVSQRKFDQANELFGRTLSMVRGQVDDIRALKLNCESASMYWEQHETDRALGGYEWVRDESQRGGHADVLAAALEGIANCHRRNGQYQDAIDQAALALGQYEWREYLDAPETRSNVALRGVSVALKLARWRGELGHDSAESFVDVARAIRETQPDDRLQAPYLDGLADLRLDQGLSTEAESLAHEAVELAIRHHDPVTLIQARTTLAFSYLRMGRRQFAWREIDLAAHYRTPGRSLVVLALSALAAHQQNDRVTANSRFRHLLAESSARTAKNSRDFAAHDFVGYGICGLYLDDGHDLGEAVEAFRIARGLTSTPTPVLVERLRFILAELDASDRLRPVFNVL